MANVADAAPVSGQVEPPARPSIRGMLAQTEIDLRLFGMLIALAVILLVFHYPERRQADPAGQHDHAGGPGRRDRDHRDRHGAGHRLAQHRPVGGIAGRHHRDDLRPADDRLVARAGPRQRCPVQLGHRPRARHPHGRRHRRRPGVHHRLHRRALVHRHPRRTAVDPRRRLVPLERRVGIRPRSDLPAPRRERAGIHRRHVDLGDRPDRMPWRSSPCSSTPDASVAATGSRSGRCGPRS